jgi:hypothetical protein
MGVVFATKSAQVYASNGFSATRSTVAATIKKIKRHEESGA